MIRMVKCSICLEKFNGLDQLGEHIGAQHIKNASDVLHYLDKLEEKLNAIEERRK